MKGIFAVALTAAVAVLPMTPCAASGAKGGFSELISNVHAPGAQTLVIEHGKVLYDRVFGVRDLKNRKPVDEHTGFEIGSVTKQFTAAAILQLKERGKLSLSDRLGKYVPAYVRARDVTLEQMLWQVSGIPDYTRVSASPGRMGVLALIEDKPLDFKPGARWEYSNSNYYLLGEVVAAASGMPWERYVRTHIFVPAGMCDSSFSDDESHMSDVATGYRSLSHIPTTPDLPAGGDGAIVSTAHDLAKWDAALFGGKILSVADLKLMIAPGPRPNGAGGYGFGWSIDRYEGLTRYSHNGRTLGFCSAVQAYPALGAYVIFLTNTDIVLPDYVANVAFNQSNPQIFARANQRAGGEDAAITAVVKSFWNGVMSGSLDRRLLTNSENASMPDAALYSMRPALESLGPVTSWIYRGKKPSPRGPLYAYRIVFDTGSACEIDVNVTANHQISGLLFSLR